MPMNFKLRDIARELSEIFNPQAVSIIPARWHSHQPTSRSFRLGYFHSNQYKSIYAMFSIIFH